MRPIFTWFPDVGSQLSCKPDVGSTKFGDGYELRVAAGINFQPETWSVKFSRVNQESRDILAFLKARGGVESFTWTTPNEDTGTFVCREWKVTRLNGGAMEVTGDFIQVFEF